MGRLRHLIARWRGIVSLDRSESAHGRERSLDNLDGLTAAGAGDMQRGDEMGGGMPPAGWVKSYDEGRPRT
jgi:hypothetical protein